MDTVRRMVDLFLRLTKTLSAQKHHFGLYNGCKIIKAYLTVLKYILKIVHQYFTAVPLKNLSVFFRRLERKNNSPLW